MINQYYLEDKRDERYPDIYALGDMYSGLDFVFQHRYEKLVTDMKRVFDECISSSGLDIMNMGRAWVILEPVMVGEMKLAMGIVDKFFELKNED